MKPTTLLLIASLVANVALVGVFYSAGSTTPAATSIAAGNSSARSATTAGSAANTDALRTALAAGDAAALEAAGLSAEAARELALGRTFARYAATIRTTSAKAGEGKWWLRIDPSRMTREQREQLALARREMSNALIAATGTNVLSNNLGEANISFLPEAKRDALRRVLSDYEDMMDQYGSAGGIQLASDREKMKLLRSERERDIAALLTPEEFADYQMRTSPSAETLRSRYGEAIANEDQFKKLYALQKAFDDKFPIENFNGRVTPEAMKARSEASLQLQSDLRAAVGDDAYAALRRAADSDVRSIDSLVARLNLAPDTTDRVVAARDSYAAESQRIMADNATPFPQRREQLQALAARAKTDLAGKLGAEAADAYAQRSPWVSMLQSGIGFSTNPKDATGGTLSLGGSGGPNVYPVMPAGMAAGGVRQIVNMVNTSSGPGPGGGGQLFFSGSGDGAPTRTQVISVSSTVTGDGHGPVEATTTTTAQPPVPATPPKP